MKSSEFWAGFREKLLAGRCLEVAPLVAPHPLLNRAIRKTDTPKTCGS